MEVLAGPTLSIEVPPSTMPPAKHHQAVDTVSPTDSPARSCLFVAEEEDAVSEGSPISSSGGSCLGLVNQAPDESSDSSSSIGAPDDSDDEEDDDENGTVVTSSAKDVLGSLDSLEEALPAKRGLSNHYSGKSKSFGNLADMSSVNNRVKELEKPENPFNKRRRILMANKWARKSFYSSSNPKSMPLLTLKEADEDDYGDVEDKDDRSPSSPSSATQEQVVPHQKPRMMLKLYQRRFGSSFKSSQSCFSLADLQEEAEEEDEEQYHQ